MPLASVLGRSPSFCHPIFGKTWETDEGETNAFAAPGRSGAMVIPQDVLELRAARVKTMRQKSARNK